MATERIGAVLARNGRNTREARGLTQQQVAAGVGEGWSKATVSAVESGRRHLSIAQLILYARALGVGVPALLRDDNIQVPLVGDLTPPQVLMVLTGETVELPPIEAGMDTMRAADLDRLAAKRLGIPVSEVRAHARAHFGGRTLHRERERLLEEYVTQQLDYAGQQWVRYEQAQAGYDLHLIDSTPEGRQTIAYIEVKHKLESDVADARAAAEKAKRQAERVDTPQTRGHITRELLDDLEQYVAATRRQHQRGKA